MAYTKTKWINGVTPINANNLNNMENGIESLFKEIDEMMTMKKINGTSLTIEDGKKIKEFKVYGKSEQDGTPTPDAPVEIKTIGIENLFDKDNYLTVDGFINASTYTIQAATNGQKSAYVKVKPNTQYYISDFNFNSAIVVGSFTDVPKVGDVATNHIIKSATTTDLTITTGENDNYIAFMISNASSTTDTSKMQIVEGTEKKPYVPYGNYLRIEHNEEPVYVNMAKENLFDGEIELGNIDLTTGDNADNTTRTRSKNFIKVKPNTTYYYSYNDGSNRWIIGYDLSKEIVTDGTYDGTYKGALCKFTNKVGGVFKTTPTTEYIRWYDTQCTDTNEKIKIYEGSSSKDYYDLCSIEDIKDEYEVVSGKGIKRIGEIVLDGDENWVLNTSASTSNGYYEFQVEMNDKPNKQVDLLCDMFQVETSYNNSKEQIRNRADYDIYINILGSRLESQDVAGFKKWLSNNPITIQYELATPEEFTLEPTTIPMEELGINNYYVNDTLEPNIDCTYYAIFGSSSSGGSSEPTGDTLPIGTLVGYAGENEPSNWLICDGRAVSRTEYSELFNTIGTTFGEGDGSTTFNIPNHKGKTIVGLDLLDEDFNVIGKTGGEKEHTLTIDEMPSHDHTSTKTSFLTNDGSRFEFASGGTNSYSMLASEKTATTGGGQPHNNMQPYIVQNYIIKAKQSVGLLGNIVTDINATGESDVPNCQTVKNAIAGQILTASFTTTTITASPTKITLNNSVTIGDKLTISNGGIKISGDVTKIKINYDVTWSSKTSGSKGVMIYKNSQSDSNLITRTIYNTDNPVQPTIVASPRVVNVVQNDILYVYCADSVGASISGALSQVTVEVIE